MVMTVTRPTWPQAVLLPDGTTGRIAAVAATFSVRNSGNQASPPLTATLRVFSGATELRSSTMSVSSVAPGDTWAPASPIATIVRFSDPVGVITARLEITASAGGDPVASAQSEPLGAIQGEWTADLTTSFEGQLL